MVVCQHLPERARNFLSKIKQYGYFLRGTAIWHSHQKPFRKEQLVQCKHNGFQVPGRSAILKYHLKNISTSFPSCSSPVKMLAWAAEAILLNVSSQSVSICTATSQRIYHSSLVNQYHPCVPVAGRELQSLQQKREVTALERSHTEDKIAIIVHIFHTQNHFKLRASWVDCNYN